MNDGLFIQDGIIIPWHELEITASRSGGPGGQHVNKTSSRITVRWNLTSSSALDETQKERIRKKSASELTTEGDFVIQSSTSRSQLHNKKHALEILAEKIRKGLYIPPKRIKTKIPTHKKEMIIQKKKQRSALKQMRRKKYDYE